MPLADKIAGHPVECPARGGKQDQMTLNLRRGFFRAWIVLTVGWVVGVGAYFLMQSCEWMLHARPDQIGPIEFQQCSDSRRLALALAIGFVPPIASLGFGFVVRWIGTGFAPSPPN